MLVKDTYERSVRTRDFRRTITLTSGLAPGQLECG